MNGSDGDAEFSDERHRGLIGGAPTGENISSLVSGLLN